MAMDASAVQVRGMTAVDTGELPIEQNSMVRHSPQVEAGDEPAPEDEQRLSEHYERRR